MAFQHLAFTMQSPKSDEIAKFFQTFPDKAILEKLELTIIGLCKHFRTMKPDQFGHHCSAEHAIDDVVKLIVYVCKHRKNATASMMAPICDYTVAMKLVTIVDTI